MSNKMNILLISGISPSCSAGLGNGIIQSLIDRGHDVDFITKYKFENMNSNMYSVYDKYEENDNLFFRVQSLFKRIFKRIFTNKNKQGKYFFAFNEKNTWVGSNLLLSKLPKTKYDLILVLFWNYMVSAKILDDIFIKLQAPILLCVVDMLPITGGCYYLGECKRYLGACGLCPEIKSDDPKDFTYHNFLYKKSVYNSINCYYGGNTWLCEYAKQSQIINDTQIKKLFLPINENVFKIRNQNEIRSKLGISKSKKNIIFVGAEDLENERKGFKYLIEAVNLFYNSLDVQRRSEVLLLLAGKIIDESKLLFEMDIAQFGFVNEEDLAELYSASDVFLCSSIDDAGPTMINQSIMCGTPVISFDIGVAQDIILNDETGYRVKNKDSKEFGEKVKKFFELDFENRTRMRDSCRKIAVEKYSLDAFAARIEMIYEEIA